MAQAVQAHASSHAGCLHVAEGARACSGGLLLPRAQRPSSLQPAQSFSFARGAAGGLLAQRPGSVLPIVAARRRQLAAAPRAGLWNLPPDLVAGVQTGTGLALAVALTLSALPILTGEARERNERRFLQPNADEGLENMRWSVMAVLSFIPFISPLAWVFAALDDEEASTLYLSFAIIYSLPYLANGLELDGFALLSLVLGVAHVQVERIAQTEPVEVELPSVLTAILRGIPKAFTSLGRYSSRLGSEVGSRARSAEDARKRRPDRKYLEERSRDARMELEEFDRKRRERERQKDGNGSEGEGRR